MRLVLDTNVLVAAFAAHGVCSELLEHCALHHQIIVSEVILAEFGDVLVRKFSFTQAEASAAEQLLRTRVELVAPTPLPQQVCRDPDDDAILAAAQAGGCGVIITGDKDLITLKAFKGIRIVPPAAFWPLETEIAEQARGPDAQ